MSYRIPRVNALIKKELDQIFLRDIDFPENTLVTITRVDSSSNLIQARVYISVMPESQKEKVFRILNKAIYELQQKINRHLRMRPVPKLIFVLEEETQKAARIEKLLEDVKNNENS